VEKEMLMSEQFYVVKVMQAPHPITTYAEDNLSAELTVRRKFKIGDQVQVSVGAVDRMYEPFFHRSPLDGQGPIEHPTIDWDSPRGNFRPIVRF
jgi:hypothetical protein